MKQDLIASDEAPPRSPFLPNTNIQFAWDSTSIGYFKTCPQLYKYIMIDGWAEKDQSIHLRYGQEFHTCLEEYEKLRKGNQHTHDEALHIILADLLIRIVDFNPSPDTKAGRYKSRKSLIRAVIWYLDGRPADPAKVLILPDGRPAVELSFRFELSKGPGGQTEIPYMLCGHLDSVVQLGEELYVMDHKTTTTTPGSYYFNQFEPNNQMTLYTLASQVVLEAPIAGVIINAVQLLVDSVNPQRGMTLRTPDQLSEWIDDLQLFFATAEAYAVRGHWPKNDTACDKFGGCRFREICNKSPGVRENFLKSNFVKLPVEERWNPLKSR